jgi:hypothetical protein
MNIKAIFEPMSSMWSLLFSSSNHFCKVSTKEMLDYGREIVAGLRRSRHKPRRPCMRLAFSGRENHTGSMQSILNSNALAGPCEKPFLKVGLVVGENCLLDSRSKHRPLPCRRSPNVRHQRSGLIHGNARVNRSPAWSRSLMERVGGYYFYYLHSIHIGIGLQDSKALTLLVLNSSFYQKSKYLSWFILFSL